MLTINKFQDALLVLESRCYESKASLADIERMYGYLLGITASMPDTKSNDYWYMRSLCNVLMQDQTKRTLKTWKAFDWIEFKKNMAQAFPNYARKSA